MVLGRYILFLTLLFPDLRARERFVPSHALSTFPGDDGLGDVGDFAVSCGHNQTARRSRIRDALVPINSP